MKIKTESLMRMIREEVRRRLDEADDREEEPEAKKKAPELHDAGRDSLDKQKAKSKETPKDEKIPKPKEPPKGKHQELGKDPADAELEQNAETEEEPEDKKKDGEKPGYGKVSDDLVGKTIQSMAINPKSKILPGAQEVVISFNELTDPLKILVTKAGKIVYFWKNQTHNVL